VVRELEFLRPLTASILSERRAVCPFGLLGGGSAAPGLNLWIKHNGRVVSLGAKATVQVEGGDRIQILTPGGGGYGPPEAAAVCGEEQQQNESEAGAALADAVSSKVEAKRRQTGSGEYSAPVRDGSSVAAYVRNQETV
jgi:5-oxoprolinase (ATP-hydrolysing)